jgi:hypothetical protein
VLVSLRRAPSIEEQIMVQEAEQIQEIKNVYAGELTLEEIVILFGIRDLFQAVIEGRAQFNLVAEVVSAKLRSLIKSGLDLNTRTNIDALLFIRQIGDDIPFLQDKRESATVTELEFAKDIVGIINFSVRNSIGISFVLNILSHDLAEILRKGSLDEALKWGFSPKSGTWRGFTDSAVGDPEPDQD